MNIADPIGFEGILTEGTPVEKQLSDLVSRLELFRGSLVNQLRKEPTVFFADPAVDTEEISGAKPGDVAVWQDDAGVQHFKILGLD